MTARTRARKLRKRQQVAARSAYVRAQTRARAVDLAFPVPQAPPAPTGPQNRPGGTVSPIDRLAALHDDDVPATGPLIDGEVLSTTVQDYLALTLKDLRKLAVMNGVKPNGLRPALCTKAELAAALAAQREGG